MGCQISRRLKRDKSNVMGKLRTHHFCLRRCWMTFGPIPPHVSDLMSCLRRLLQAYRHLDLTAGTHSQWHPILRCFLPTTYAELLEYDQRGRRTVLGTRWKGRSCGRAISTYLGTSTCSKPSGNPFWRARPLIFGAPAWKCRSLKMSDKDLVRGTRGCHF